MDKVDVIAVEIETKKILWVDPDKTGRNAQAIISMAVMRQGVEDRFFTTVEVGKYSKGDTYNE